MHNQDSNVALQNSLSAPNVFAKFTITYSSAIIAYIMELFIGALVLFVIAIIILAVWVFVLERRITKLTNGKSGASLEETINKANISISELYNLHNAVEKALDQIDNRMKRKINGVKTLRFNPFQGTGTGGNQSFAAAFLDEEGDGVVLSTLYSREKVSMFAKPIKKMTSEFDLTDEEQAVLKDR